ncbi:alpha/beta hydrolase [Actinomadura coerulea]|uniref:alpha/beta hydrolase n=1 Tax=Actinomadura coerulea TaxID=46159 RepID=UPI00343D40D4
MSSVAAREKVYFVSGGERCAAWHYPGTNGACLVMAGGLAVTKEPATDQFAERFHRAGYSVLAFDYRHLGESDGEPRQALRIDEQIADWHAAITRAAALPGVDPARVGAWAFSMSAGHLLEASAAGGSLAAIILQTPFVGGLRAGRAATRHQSPLGLLRLLSLGVIDVVGGRFGRAPITVRLTGPRGAVAVLTTPDGQLGDQALNPGNRHPGWLQSVAARSTLLLLAYRPGRAAGRSQQPVLVVVCDDDQSTFTPATLEVAAQFPDAEVAHLPGGHYSPFLEAHEQAVARELDFLDRRLLGGSR